MHCFQVVGGSGSLFLLQCLTTFHQLSQSFDFHLGSQSFMSPIYLPLNPTFRCLEGGKNSLHCGWFCHVLLDWSTGGSRQDRCSQWQSLLGGWGEALEGANLWARGTDDARWMLLLNKFLVCTCRCTYRQYRLFTRVEKIVLRFYQPWNVNSCDRSRMSPSVCMNQICGYCPGLCRKELSCIRAWLVPHVLGLGKLMNYAIWITWLIPAGN